jgi:hypothetical protein
MAIAMLVDNPDGSQDVYERTLAELDVERPFGGIFHAAGPSPSGGWRVFEVWESEEDAQRFVKDHMRPAIAAAGATPPPPPELWPIHSLQEAGGAPA